MDRRWRGKRIILFSFVVLCCKPLPVKVCRPLYRESPPEWIEKRPEDKGDTLYAVGIKTYSPSIEGGENDARMDAVRQIVERFFGMKVGIGYQKLRRSFETRVEEDLRGEGRGRIIGGKTEEVYYERCEKVEDEGLKEYYNVYLLYTASLSKIKRLLKNIEKKKEEIISKAKALLETFPPTTHGEMEKFLQISNEILPQLDAFSDEPEIIGLKSRIIRCVKEVGKAIKTVNVKVRVEGESCIRNSTSVIKQLVEGVLRKQGFSIAGESARFLCVLNLKVKHSFKILHILRIIGTLMLRDRVKDRIVFSRSFNVRGAGGNPSKACRRAIDNMREFFWKFRLNPE